MNMTREFAEDMKLIFDNMSIDQFIKFLGDTVTYNDASSLRLEKKVEDDLSVNYRFILVK